MGGDWEGGGWTADMGGQQISKDYQGGQRVQWQSGRVGYDVTLFSHGKLVLSTHLEYS